MRPGRTRGNRPSPPSRTAVDGGQPTCLAAAGGARSRPTRGGDAMADTTAMQQAFEEALRSGDFGRVTDLIREYATDDFVQEWPQSGERLTKAATIELANRYPEG